MKTFTIKQLREEEKEWIKKGEYISKGHSWAKFVPFLDWLEKKYK